MTEEKTRPYTPEQIDAMAVQGLRDAVGEKDFISTSCGDMKIERTAWGITLSSRAARAIVAALGGGGSAVVMRKAVLQEDEGRESVHRSFPSREAAQKWIEAQKGEFFGPSDYYVQEKARG